MDKHTNVQRNANTLKTLGSAEHCRANVLTYKEMLRRLD